MSYPIEAYKSRFDLNDYVYLAKNYFSSHTSEKWNIFVITDPYKSGSLHSIRVRGLSGTEYQVPIKYVKDRLIQSKFEIGDYVQPKKHGCFRRDSIFRVRDKFKLNEGDLVIVYDEHDEEYAIPEKNLIRV